MKRNNMNCLTNDLLRVHQGLLLQLPLFSQKKEKDQTLTHDLLQRSSDNEILLMRRGSKILSWFI